MVLDKSIETLEDLVRFLNRKQSFYFKLYDRYLEGDYDRLDDSRKHEADCDSVCDDIVECIKAISDEAQIRGIAKKPKVLCTLDGQDEEKYILDEWLLKVVRLLDDKANWNRMLAPVEGKDMNNAFDAILFRLTYVANFLKELSTKTEQEYYGGRRTDVMPYYIGESKLKEHFFYAPPHHEEDEEDIIIGYIAAVRDYQTQKTKYVDDEGKVCSNKSQAKVFDIKGKADNYSYEHCPEGWTHFVVALKKSDILKEGIGSLGKGFRQGIFDKDSVLTSKSEDDKKSMWVAKIYNYDDSWDEYYIDEDGEPVDYIDKAKVFDNEQDAEDWAEENRLYNWGAYASKLSESKKRLKELTQDEFNRLARRRDEFRAQTAISPAEKNNLYADIKDFEEEFRDLQDTAERLPDAYIDQVCDTASYPFDVAIDEVQNVEDWCSEAEEFLKDDINNWGIMKESKKRFKEAIDDFPKNTHQMYRFAKQKHDATGAVRKHSGDPYWVHPEGVAKIAAAYGGTDIEIQAAMAHDTLEDTNCSYEELEEMFGDEVASIVREITNDTEEVDRLGKEQYINLELISLSHPALFVKLCDMYYNQMDFPTEAQKRRMIKNINYLLANREDDLNENEIALIEDILQTLLY